MTQLSPKAAETLSRWLENASVDESTKAELRALENEPQELEERFYRDLEFGTGGLRGVIGAGSNRINRYTVGRATQGFAKYILEKHTGEEDLLLLSLMTPVVSRLNSHLRLLLYWLLMALRLIYSLLCVQPHNCRSAYGI